MNMGWKWNYNIGSKTDKRKQQKKSKHLLGVKQKQKEKKIKSNGKPETSEGQIFWLGLFHLLNVSDISRTYFGQDIKFCETCITRYIGNFIKSIYVSNQLTLIWNHQLLLHSAKYEIGNEQLSNICKRIIIKFPCHIYNFRSHVTSIFFIFSFQVPLSFEKSSFLKIRLWLKLPCNIIYMKHCRLKFL